MFIDDIINLKEIIAQPISEEKPTGDPLSDDAHAKGYYALKTLRSEARFAERKNEQEDENVGYDLTVWKQICSQASDILSQQSKDIDIACWLLEGLVRIDGFAGLSFAVTLINRMFTEFSMDVYPLVEDEDDLATKFNSLMGLDGGLSEGALIKPLRMISLIEENNLMTNYALWQFQQAHEVAQLNDEAIRQQRIEEGAVVLSDFHKMFSQNSMSFLTQQKQFIENGLAQLDELGTWLDTQLGAGVVSFGNIRTELKQSLDIFRKELIRRDQAALNSEGDVLLEGATQQAEDIAQSRDKMLAQLESIAAAFAEREPHSPIPSLLQQAVRWANLSLSELMQEILQTPGAYQEYCRITGFSSDSMQIMPDEDDMSHSFV